MTYHNQLFRATEPRLSFATQALDRATIILFLSWHGHQWDISVPLSRLQERLLNPARAGVLAFMELSINLLHSRPYTWKRIFHSGTVSRNCTTAEHVPPTLFYGTCGGQKKLKRDQTPDTTKDVSLSEAVY